MIRNSGDIQEARYGSFFFPIRDFAPKTPWFNASQMFETESRSIADASSPAESV